MAEAAHQESEEVTQWVTFRLGEENYGVNVMQVQEVLRVSEIAPVPGAPDYVLGIINLRGNVVSVLDTRCRFGLPDHATDDASRIIIIELDAQTIGILVDSVAEVEDVRSGEVDSAPAVGNEDAARYIGGVVSRKDGLLILVDVQRLLNEQEWRDVSAL